MAAGAIAKPQLRGLLADNIKKAIIGASIFSVICGLAWNFGVLQPKKQKYADFYKTYDPAKRIKLMCERGLLQSCGPHMKKK